MRLGALALLVVLMAAAALVLLRSPWNYAAQDRQQIAAGSSPRHWSGTDELGRDRATRVALASIIGLAGAIVASALATCIAVSIGVSAAFAPRGVAAGLMYFSDLFLALPWLFLLMMVRSALPLSLAPAQSAVVTFLLLALLGWPAYARLTYARTYALLNSTWMIQGRASGLRTKQLARRHVLPHLRPLVLSQFLICIPACIVAEANLGTLGLGVSEPLPSWGSMLLALEHSAVLASSGWVYFPIVLLVLLLVVLEMLVFEVYP